MNRISGIVFCLLVALLLLTSAIRGGAIESVASLLLLLVLCATAFPVIRFILPHLPGTIVFVLPIGYILHSALLSLVARIFGISGTVLFLYLFLAVGTAWFFRKQMPSRTSDAPDAQPWAPADTLLLAIWMFLSLCLVALPFLRVGETTPAGIAYRAYFDADFFRNMAVTASLSHSGIPPANPYVGGEILHYYWFFFTIPAYFQKIFPGLRLDSILVQFSAVSVCLFVAALFYVVRSFARSRQALLFLFPVFAFGGSYEGIYVLQELERRGLEWRAFAAWNIDGILRWHWNAPQIDSLYRALLYAPQHLIPMCLFLLAFLVWSSRSGTGARMWLWFLIFCSIGMSTFIGGSLVLIGGAFILIRLFRRQPGAATEIIASAVAGAAFLIVYFPLLQMFHSESRGVSAGLDPAIREHFFTYFLFNWGLLLPLGLAGIIKQTDRFPRVFLGCLLVFCFGMIVFVKLNMQGGSDISLKLGHFSHVVLLIAGAGFLDWLLVRGVRRIAIAAVLLLLLVPSAMTWCMEAYNAADTANTKFTTYVSPGEFRVFQWMKKNLETDAVVLNYSRRFEQFRQDRVAPLAERPVFLGNRIFSSLFQVPLRTLQARQAKARAALAAESAPAIAQVLNGTHVDYILIGNADEFGQVDVFSRFSPPCFSLVLRDERTALYRFNKACK